MPALEITTTIPCTNMCDYCPQSILLKKYGRSNQHMMLNTFKQCMSNVPKKVEIHFSGYSECFLNVDCIDFIEYTQQQGYEEIHLYTTLVGLNYEQLQRLSVIKFKNICLHLPDDERVMKYNVTKEYIHIVDEFIKIFNPKSIVVYGKLNKSLIPVVPHYSSNINNNALHSRANNLPHLKSNPRLNGKIGCRAVNCRRPLDRVVLLPDGNVALCCMDYNLQHIIGNLTNMQFDQIFQTPQYKFVEKGLDDDSLNILCRNCQEAVKC